MPLTAHQRRQLLLADRTADGPWIRSVIESVLEANETANLLDVELAFRDAAAHTYVLAVDDGFEIVRGVLAWREVLRQAKMSPKQNRALLAGKILIDR
jgi:hypothetical protein